MFRKYLFLVYDSREVCKCGDYFNCPVEMIGIGTMWTYRKTILPDIMKKCAGKNVIVTRARSSGMCTTTPEKPFAEYYLKEQRKK